ncbi:MAG: sodium:proton antiporter [Porphyromonadaceae bacterium CG2_30_38_12]|nr:MAG: sodium:proton antiporter [Porphyromonadaceae bacterium CG2_30_38_12]
MITLISVIFVLGYTAIALEHKINIDKTASALLTGVFCWLAYILYMPEKEFVNETLLEHLGDVSGILFFLLGAMTIIELIDAHDGFEIVNKLITQTNKKKLVWIIGFITFFISALLDNLTTTIVMIAILRKLVHRKEERLLFAGIIVIAANAGGAWSPIGDVTTTMLWIGGQISTLKIILTVFLPSIVSLIIPLIIISFQLKGNFPPKIDDVKSAKNLISQRQQLLVLISGLGALLFVPVFKTITHLPPFMGMLLGVSFLWILTELLHGKEVHTMKKHLSIGSALQRIDTPSILFFLGILMAVAALQTSGILVSLAETLTNTIGNINAIVMTFGLASSVVDNVPLVAASQGMYSLAQYPMDDYLWQFLAYCAGTGGSILIIGSAAGVAAMGMEKIDFFWYIKNISWLALLGYFAGAFFYIIQNMIFL